MLRTRVFNCYIADTLGSIADVRFLFFGVPFYGNDNKNNFEIMEVVNQNQDDLPNSDIVDSEVRICHRKWDAYAVWRTTNISGRCR